MIKHENDLLYMQDSIDKQLQIAFDGGTITNKEIPSEQFSLTESLSSDGLMFGSCEASEIKFRIYNVFTPLKDKWLTVTQVLDKDFENPLQIGKYKVYSDKPTADRSYRDVVAYDSMYDIINADVASWYNSLTFPMQLKTFRDSFFDYFGIEQEEVALVNDAMTIEKTIEPSVLSGKDVLQSICQINGCFGHIGRDGKMQYVFLKRSIDGGLFPDTELYPSDKLFPVKESIRNNLYPYNNLYPSDDLIPVKSISSDSTYPQIITTIPKSAYIHCYYEDYIVKKIDKLIIRQEENDVGCTVGNGDNAYIIEDNFLVYGKSQEELTEIATNTLAVIEDIEYRPITDSEVLGNPCLEVGDAIRFYTRYEIVDSYILNRTLKGIQGLVDSYVSDGEEYQSEKVNDIQTDIKQLKGKSNTLERTVEETRSTISDVENSLQSEISQTADTIRLEVADNAGKISTIEQDIDSITQTVEDNKKELSSRIDQTVSNISLTVNNGDSTAGIVITLINEDGSTSEVTGTIDMTGLVTFTDLLTQGQTVINGSNITTGQINCDLLNGGTINGQTIKGGSIEGSNISATDSFRMLIASSPAGAIMYYGEVISTSKELRPPYSISQNKYTTVILGNQYNCTAIYGQPYMFDGTSLHHIPYCLTSSLGNIQYFTLASNTSKGTYIHCQTTVEAYGITIWESDTKLKTNILETEQTALDKINQLEFIQFDWKKNGGHVDLGLSANQLEEIIPNAVFEVEQGAGSEYDTLKNIDTPTLTTYSLKAIQEMSKIIETQQQEIEELKKSVSFLMKEIERLGGNNE